jgi:hypothetical protein
VDPGKCGHARNRIPGIPPSRNRIDDVTSGPPVPRAALGVLCLPDTSPVLAHPWSRTRRHASTHTHALTICQKFPWVLTRCFESPSTPPPHPPQAHRARCVSHACWGFGGGISGFCYYIYHSDSILGVILTILCIIFVSESVRRGMVNGLKGNDCV